jgi:hypothetical protein
VNRLAATLDFSTNPVQSARALLKRTRVPIEIMVDDRKVPREVFSELHDRLGTMLLEEAKRLAGQEGPVRDFLNANPLPERLKQYLPGEYRSF